MKYTFLTLIILITCSCELHKQEVVTAKEIEAKVVDLSSIDTLITSVLQNDYHMTLETLEKLPLELNVINEQGKLLLNEAVKLDRLLIGELLVFYGANAEAFDNANQSAIKLIEQSKYSDEWKRVLEGGSASEQYFNSESIKLISEAALDSQESRIDLLKLYIEKGLDVNHISEDNKTLLMIATSKNLHDIIDYLCSVENFEPNLSVTVTRRRREYHITAMYYAQNELIKSTLRRCGVL